MGINIVNECVFDSAIEHANYNIISIHFGTQLLFWHSIKLDELSL